MVRRSWCILFALWLLLPVSFAEDFGLVNPVEKDFNESKSATQNKETFAKKKPAFNDRPMPTSPKTVSKTEDIRQVSASDGDPFPVVTQPTAMPYIAYDWGIATPPAPSNVLPSDPNVYGGYGALPAAMQNMEGQIMAGQDMYGAGTGLNCFPYLMQYPQQFQHQQYQQGAMINGVNPYVYANPYGNPYANQYPQYVNAVDSYGMMYPTDNREMPDYSSVYQAIMAQEMMRRQAAAQASQEEDAEEKKNQADNNWSLNNLVPVRVSSPLGETMFACAKTVSPFCTPTGPDKGVGMPLVGKSWLDHPYYFGGFVGQMNGSKLVSKMIDQKYGGHGGLTFGYNYSEYWGMESRFHFSAISISDTKYAKRLISDIYPDVTILSSSRTNELTIFDVAVHYYPLGNAKWRPYCKYGLGFGRQKFADSFGGQRSMGIGTMPMGVGVRYWWNERLALQADIADNIIFATGIAKTQHDFGFTIGITYAFGTGRTKHPVHYWPATPSMGTKW